MPFEHLRIPDLPERPRVHPIAGHVHRSFTPGRHNFSRACQGKPLILTVSKDEAFGADVRAILLTTLNATGDGTLAKTPFQFTDERTLTCSVTPTVPGFHAIRTEFSVDGGNTWRRDNVPDAWVLVDPPLVDGLLVYTMIPAISGTLADWKADLRRIREMGFNAIHILPVTAQDTSESPYAAKDLFAIDPGYLIQDSPLDGLQQLGEFIEEAKALGLRLCFDLVLNHVGVDSTMATRAPDWIVPDENQADRFQRAGYWAHEGWRTWDDLVLINYEHPSEAVRSEIWAYMTEYALFWAKFANDTGGFVRFDNLHSSDPRFVLSLTEIMHKTFPEVAVLAEYFTDDSTLLKTVPDWSLNLLLATPWNLKFVPDLREYLTYIHRVSGHVRYLMPITSHDSGSPAQEFGSVESTVPRYLAAALLGTGATGIPQGVEFGELERAEFIGRKSKTSYPSDAMFGLFIGRVNAILSEYPAFRRGENCQFVDDGHASIIAAFRRDTAPDVFGFLVLGNFDIYSPQSIVVDLAPYLEMDGPFSCLELISGEARTVEHPRIELTLPPCGAQVLRFDKKPEP